MPTPAAAKFAELKKQVADARKAMKATAKAVFVEASADLFKNNTNLLSFGWSQYTPYWNDGDTCTFSANTEYPTCSIKAKDGKVIKYDVNMCEMSYDDDEVEFNASEVDRAKYDKEFDKIESRVKKFLGAFDDDDLETMFGDHTKVTITRDGKVHIEEYEHE